MALALQALTGRCRGAIAAAVRRLERVGIIKVTRRLKRIAIARLSPITGTAASLGTKRGGGRLSRRMMKGVWRA
jgi:hypothetical protein